MDLYSAYLLPETLSCFQTNGSALKETNNLCECIMQEHFSYLEKTSTELIKKMWNSGMGISQQHVLLCRNDERVKKRFVN